MPNDENTQQVQQNQNLAVGSNWSANSWASDDFDLDFGSDVGSSIWDSSQGRTWMFLTPDEEAQKEELQNSWQPFSFGKDEVQDSSSVVDAEENGGWSLFNPNVNANIDVAGNDMGEVSESEEATDNKFDDKIEDLISFDDDWPTSVSESLQNVDVEPLAGNWTTSENDETNGDLLWDSPLNSQEVVQDQTSLENVNLGNTDTDSVVENTETTEDIESTNINEWWDNAKNDDWLQQEDKKVEETFGTENLDSSPNIEVDESPADVAQNVENLLVSNTVSDNWLWSVVDNQQNTEQYVPSEEDFSAMSNLLNSSSAWQVDINNENTQPVNNFGFVNNVENFDTNIVSDWSQAQWNISDVNSNVSMQNTEYQQNIQPNFDNQQVSMAVDNQQETFGNSSVSADINWSIWSTDNNWSIWTADINWNTFNQVGLDSQVNPQIQGNQVYTEVPMNQPTPAETPINQNVDLNSMWTLWWVQMWNVVNNMENVNNQWWVSLDAILDQEIQNMHVENPGMNQTNYVWPIDNNQQVQGQMWQQVVYQEITGKKRKKQSWFIVIWIFLWVIVVLWLLWYFAFKMFPDKFHNIFKNDVVVEYLAWNENNISTEWVVNDNQWGENIDIDEVDNLENFDEQEVDGELLDDNVLENESWDETNWDVENWEEELDPNSLAGLLSEDESTTESGDVSESGDDENDNWWQNSEESNVENTDDGDTNGDDFDPYAEIGGVISEVSDSDKLNEYISQWNYYKELWVTNNDRKMEKYGEYIVVTATEELWKLENWEEIDNTIYGRLDEILESLE